MNDKKIALCFTGRVSCFKQSLPWFERVFLNDPNVDVFCSINGECDEHHREFLKLFRVKKAHFQKFVMPYSESIFVHNKRPESNVYNVHSMCYNKKKCFELVVQENIPYDNVIFFRTDIVAERLYPYDTLCEKSTEDDKEIIHIPAGFDWGGFNDQIAHGSMKAMEIYTSLYDKILYYCRHEGCMFHPETLLKFHLDRNNSFVKIERFSFPYHLNSKRAET